MLARTVAHKTGIPIAAVDISPYKTHAILAGKEILKTVRIADRKITEDLNLRSAVISYASAHGSQNGAAIASKRRDFLPATDVKWSHGEYDSFIATASNNGRLSIYDVRRPEIELLWLHEHTRQVHKLGFNPFQGALLLSGGHDGTVKYWDLRESSRERSSHTLKSTKQFSGRAEAIRDLRWSPTDGVEFVTCTDGGTVFKWDSRKTDRPELRINGHEKACYSVDWHPDGRYVVSGSADKNVRVWDFKNPDRRQKPCFQFRAPQTVMNIRWRPASWTSTLHGKNDWQSTQLAIGYNADDPRVHIWDLRRPLVPFRELDRYNGPATSLLWCTDNLLWTVGNEGMFTQTDVQYSPQPLKEISPCTANWLATGEYAVFTEDQGCRRSIASEDLSVGFRPVSHDDFSSGEQVTTSRSMTDDEGVHKSFLGPSYKCTQPNRASVMSVKSLGNSPPSRDDQNPVLSLDKAVFEKGSMMHNRQVGVIGKTTGAATNLPTFRFLAENYARPATEAERKQDPAQVLYRLEQAFKTNGDVCDQVSMHRTGQTWRVLGFVILPELQAWADRNRRERLNQAVPKSPSLVNKANASLPEIKVPHTKTDKKIQGHEGMTGTNPLAQRDVSKENVRNDWQKLIHETESTSNMTTPLARPMPDSTLSTLSKSPRTFLSLNDPSEPILPLPLSVVAAHSTAAAASQVLRNDVDKDLTTLPSTEDSASDRPGDIFDSSLESSHYRTQSQGAAPQAMKRPKPDWISSGDFRTGEHHRREQNKRAALLQYKAQPRTILNFDSSFEENSQRGFPITIDRHDSADSLQMFSESTSSSHKTMALSESPEASYENKPPITSDDWDYHHQERSEPSFSSHDDAEVLDQRTMDHQRSTSRNSHRSTLPSPDGPFEFEQFSVRNHIHSEVRTDDRSPVPIVRQRVSDRQISPSPTADELQSPDYIFLDFQPIDISSHSTTGQARLWFAIQLISQAIAFDLTLGENHAQFSTHLLMHTYPFFFHQRYRNERPYSYPSTLPQTLADRLYQPHLSHRVIESIFQQHHTYLKSLSIHLAAAELRNLCVEFDIPSVYRPRLTPDDEPSITLNDGYSLSITCTNPTCSAPLNLSARSQDEGPTSCDRCHTPRPPCPICLSLKAPRQHLTSCTPNFQKAAETEEGGSARLWTFCQSCGHSTHMSCMEVWLRRPSTEGECPTAGCGHDCAPGELRRRRVAELAAAAAATTTNGEKQALDTRGRNGGDKEGLVAADRGRGGKGGRHRSSMKDKWKAPQSAAVERTRGLLRSSVASTVGTGSESDGSGRAAAGGGAAGGGGGGGRKVVRLMTPGEEISQAVDDLSLS